MHVLFSFPYCDICLKVLSKMPDKRSLASDLLSSDVLSRSDEDEAVLRRTVALLAPLDHLPRSAAPLIPHRLPLKQSPPAKQSQLRLSHRCSFTCSVSPRSPNHCAAARECSTRRQCRPEKLANHIELASKERKDRQIDMWQHDM